MFFWLSGVDLGRKIKYSLLLLLSRELYRLLITHMMQFPVFMRSDKKPLRAAL
jgi:hypothetical protein